MWCWRHLGVPVTHLLGLQRLLADQIEGYLLVLLITLEIWSLVSSLVAVFMHMSHIILLFVMVWHRTCTVEDKLFLTLSPELLVLLCTKITYLFSFQVTVCDFQIYDILDAFKVFEPKLLADSPKLEEYHERFEELPAIKAYISSEKFISRPINNTCAQWFWVTFAMAFPCICCFSVVEITIIVCKFV